MTAIPAVDDVAGLVYLVWDCRRPQGRVTVDSQPGQGATFSLYLPEVGPDPKSIILLPETGARFDDTISPAGLARPLLEPARWTFGKGPCVSV